MSVAAVLPWLLAAAGAQDPAPAPAPAPLPAPVPAPGPIQDPAALERAQALLRAHAGRSRAVRVLVADYVQRRTTTLLKEPLLSRGEFLFVREPACVVFRAAAPRPSVVRLTATTYEVFRPQQQQLERFHLDGPELAEGLFAAVGGDVDRLLRDFVVTACAPHGDGAARVQLHFAPRSAAARERLRELILTLHAADGALAAVAYRDPAGDLVEIGFDRLRADPPSPPSGRLEVPPGTRVVEHAVRRKPA